MPAELKKDSRSTFTLVCGHLSSRICLNPDPRDDQRRLRGDLKTQPKHSNIRTNNNNSTYNSNDNQDGNNATNEQRIQENNDGSSGEGNANIMDVDPVLSQGKKGLIDNAPPSSTTPSEAKRTARSEFGAIHKQTLHNQGSTLASDLSIIGFMKLDAVRSPPVISRHWIVMDRPEEQDAIAKTNVKEELAIENNDSSLPIKQPKPEDSLVVTLFPPHPPPPPPPSSHFPPQQRQYQHQHHQPNFQLNFNNSPGGTHMSKMLSTNSKSPGFHQDNSTNSMPLDQPSHSSAQQHTVKFPGGKKNEKGIESWGSSENLSQQHLYSILYKALEQESMVAIVALQYPDKNCTRLRKWRRTHEDSQHKNPKPTSSSSTTASLLSKRLSHSQGASPSLSAPGVSDMGLLSSSPTFSSLTGSGLISSTGSVLPKDDPSFATAMASLSNVVESDRNWYGLLMAASHFFASPFHSAPVHMNGRHDDDNHSEKFVLLILPKSTVTSSAPWIPDLNHDKPQFPLRVPPLETQLMFMHSSKKANNALSNTSLIQNVALIARDMEQFGNIKTIMRNIRSNLPALFFKDGHGATPKLWNRNVAQKIQHNLRRISDVYGYKSGVKCATRLLNTTLSNFEHDTVAHQLLSHFIQHLLKAYGKDGIMDEFDARDFEKEMQSRASRRRDAPLISPTLSGPIKVVGATEDDKNGGIVKTEKNRAKIENNASADLPVLDSTALHPTNTEPHDEDEGADENMEGGSVLIRPIIAQSPDAVKQQKAEDTIDKFTAAAIEQEQESKQSSQQQQQPLVQDHPRRTLEAEDDIEQDLVLEQSSVPQTHRPPTQPTSDSIPSHTLPESPQQHKRTVSGDQLEPKLMGSGLTPQKRRRQILDDASDAASSAVNIPERTSIPPRDMPQPGGATPHESSSVLSILRNNGEQGGPTAISVKKGAKKSKRIKAEQTDNAVPQDLYREPVILSDDESVATKQELDKAMPTAYYPNPATFAQVNQRVESDQIQTDSTRLQHSPPPIQQMKAKASKKQTKASEQTALQQRLQQQQQQQQQHQAEEHQQKRQQHTETSQQQAQQLLQPQQSPIPSPQQQQQQQRQLPPPTFVNQHQRTPSGTPQWLAANTTPSILSNIKVAGRNKKASTNTQASQSSQQPPHQALQELPQQSPQQTQQHPSQQPQLQIQQQLQQQYDTHHPYTQQQPQRQQAHHIQQMQQPPIQQQPQQAIHMAPSAFKEERSPMVATSPRSHMPLNTAYRPEHHSGSLETQQRRQIEMTDAVDSRQLNHDSKYMTHPAHQVGVLDPAAHPSGTRTPPLHQRSPSGQGTPLEQMHPSQVVGDVHYTSSSSRHHRQASGGYPPGGVFQPIEKPLQRPEIKADHLQIKQQEYEYQQKQRYLQQQHQHQHQHQ
ncbi:hypothetical protein BX616_003421, partial [Lobosporangium transversale]